MPIQYFPLFSGTNLNSDEVSWGSIIGTLTNQSDLQSALNSKSSISHNHDSTYEPKNSNIQNHISDTDIHVTSEEKEEWNNALSNSGSTNSSSVWGNITGNINNQVDLTNKFSNKSDADHTHTGVYEPANSNIQSHINSNSNPHSVTASQVGLGNVTNDAQLKVSNLDTATSLGNSDTKIPSQNAVKTYVDSAISGISGSGSASNTITNAVWSDTFSCTYSSSTSITYTASTSAIATKTAYSLTNKYIHWLASDGSTVKVGFIVNATASSTSVTININGSAVVSNDTLTSFRITNYLTVQSIDWFRYGQVIADSSYPQGKHWRLSSNYQVISCSAYVETAASGSGADLTYNIYDGSTALFSTPPSFGTNSSVLNSVPSTVTLTGGNAITLRLLTSAGATNYASNFNCIANIIPVNILGAV